MNILSIGNSFSQDAQRYLHQIAKADGYNLNAFNLYIGGCSLSTHYRNMISKQKEYTLEMNGESTGFNVSLEEALLNRDWDIITLQQASFKSPYYETYQPYLNKMVEHIQCCVPKAKLAIHQTWAYEAGSKLLCNDLGYNIPDDMFNDIKSSYDCAAKDIGAELIIPSGELLHRVSKEGLKIHRDTFHVTFGLGRYALGLLWYHTLTGKEISENTFNDFDETILGHEIDVVKKCIKDMF